MIFLNRGCQKKLQQHPEPLECRAQCKCTVQQSNKLPFLVTVAPTVLLSGWRLLFNFFDPKFIFGKSWTKIYFIKKFPTPYSLPRTHRSATFVTQSKLTSHWRGDIRDARLDDPLVEVEGKSENLVYSWMDLDEQFCIKTTCNMS
jgi:hypothetical protein